MPFRGQLIISIIMPKQGALQSQTESNTGLSSNCSSRDKSINLRLKKKKEKKKISVEFVLRKTGQQKEDV